MRPTWLKIRLAGLLLLGVFGCSPGDDSAQPVAPGSGLSSTVDDAPAPLPGPEGKPGKPLARSAPATPSSDEVALGDGVIPPDFDQSFTRWIRVIDGSSSATKVE